MTVPNGLWKTEGAGNDFILGTGEWARRLATDTNLVAALCRRRRGIGADGTLALLPDGPNRVRLVYRNQDGGRAHFCANGTRCAALAAHRLLGMPGKLTVATDAADVPAVVSSNGVTLDLMAPSAPPRAVELVVHADTWLGALLTIGVPHLILMTEDPAAIDLEAVAPELRHHCDLGPEGANVSFVSRLANGAVTIRTWERGVEAETLCCGSAILAVGVLEFARSDRPTIACHPKSGDVLTVSRLGNQGLRLTGPARIVAEIRPIQKEY